MLTWAPWPALQLSTQIFLIETVPEYTASALAAHTIASSVGGSMIPLSTFPIYERVGYGWGNTIIASINMGLCLITVTMLFVSKKLPDTWNVEIRLEEDTSSHASQGQRATTDREANLC